MRMPPTAVAQVDTVYPDEGKIALVFPNLSMLTGIRVKVAFAGASARTGSFGLPKRGDWGLVAFYQDDPRSCVWLIALPDDVWNSLPAEVLKEDPHAQVTYHPSGVQHIRRANGDEEVLRPDGTLMTVTHSGRDKNAKTPRKVTEPEGRERKAARRAYSPPALEPATVHLHHATGTEVTVHANGNVEVTTAGGLKVLMDDAAQKVHTTAPTIIEEGIVKLGGPGASKLVVLDKDPISGTIFDSHGAPCTFTLKVDSSASKPYGM